VVPSLAISSTSDKGTIRFCHSSWKARSGAARCTSEEGGAGSLTLVELSLSCFLGMAICDSHFSTLSSFLGSMTSHAPASGLHNGLSSAPTAAQGLAHDSCPAFLVNGRKRSNRRLAGHRFRCTPAVLPASTTRLNPAPDYLSCSAPFMSSVQSFPLYYGMALYRTSNEAGRHWAKRAVMDALDSVVGWGCS
jgi:hypothetical protein